MPFYSSIYEEWMPGTVELMVDSRGVYGVGEKNTEGKFRQRLILRPDKIEAPIDEFCALQRVPWSRFCGTIEGNLVDTVHRGMYARHDQISADDQWPPWSESSDPKLEWRIWYGLRRSALKIANNLIGHVLEVADPRALKAARRFPMMFRIGLYNAFCRYGERAIQLSEAFPLLAVILFSDRWGLEGGEESRQRHVGLVLAGEKLRRISDSLEIHYAFKRITPKATNCVLEISLASEILKHIPATTRKQKAFFTAIAIADKLGADFTLWAAKQLAARNTPEAVAEIRDIKDWVAACAIRENGELIGQLEPEHVHENGARLVTRRFIPNMSLKTVRRLSEQWHNAIADNIRQEQLIKFPDPWIGSGKLDNYKIVPITDSAELYCASTTLHNCASTYIGSILAGKSYVYRVVDDSEQTVGMVDLAQTRSGLELGQIKERCNTYARKELQKAVELWFSRSTVMLS